MSAASYLFGVQLTRLELVGVLLAVFMLGKIVFVIRNVYFGPLSRFPGSKLAAASFWKETYYDVFKDHSYIWEIEKMHQRYGPIIRTNPYDIHINDPDFFDDLYFRRLDKWSWWTRGFSVPTSAGMTVDESVHRKRRGAMNPFFSRASIESHIPTICEKAARMCARLEEQGGTGAVLDLESIYLAFTTDVLTQCSYGYSYNYLDNPDFAMKWKLVNTAGRQSAAIVRSFPLVGKVVRSLPMDVALKLVPPVGFIKSWMADVRTQVRSVKSDPELQQKLSIDSRRKDTIFQQILASDLPANELSEDRLVDEGTLIATAGSETTAWAITITSYHLTRNPDMLTKLRDELREIMPNRGDVPTWSTLEKLPYLTAVIKEGLRMAGGMLSRFPRITDEPIVYKGWTIPAGTAVAMTPHLVLRNEVIFPKPATFSPDRWLQNPGLDKYNVAFGKGTRNCIGMHLAYAQLYIAIAVVHRRFELELFETDDSDATPSRDLFTAGVKLDSKGIRIQVLGSAGGKA